MASTTSSALKGPKVDIPNPASHVTTESNGFSMPPNALRILPNEEESVNNVPDKYKFVKVKDGRGRKVDGLWVRNKRYYYQLSIPGKNRCRRIPLVDEHNQPVRSIQQAKEAIEQLRRNKREGELPVSRRAPCFNKFLELYLLRMQELQKKKPKTLIMERSVLRRWAKHFGAIRLSQITHAGIQDYVLQRKKSGVGNRTVNMDVLILGNLFRFAKKEKQFSGKLPTDGWEPLEYRAEKQQLFTQEQIAHFCAVAASKLENGSLRFKNGEMLVDAIRLMSLSGARVSSALALRWTDVDWERRQLHLCRETKYSKHMVVDLSNELESLLKDMHRRRLPDTQAMFPTNRSDGKESVGSLRKSFEEVRKAANLPKFKFHSLRHYFASACVMAGLDLLTIASWLGHSDTLLISKTYGHLNARHKQDAARKLVFGSRMQQPKPNGCNLIDLSKITAAELLQLLQQKMQEGNAQSQATNENSPPSLKN